MPIRISIAAVKGSAFALAVLAAIALAGPATAEEDVQITSEAISRVCAEIHHTPNVQAEAPTVGGPQEITLNCRLVTTNGSTIAQLSAGEVCQRLTGSTEWYRGAGTQVYCRPRRDRQAPEPRSFTITQEDIARACQRTHHNPQATAEPPKVGAYGLELNCRLANQDGFTLARVSPEDVCYSKFGTREWIGIAGSASFLCKATPIATTGPEQLPNKGGGGGGGGGGGPPAPGSFSDVPLTAEMMAMGCKTLHGETAAASAPTHAPTPGYATRKDLIVNCSSGGGNHLAPIGGILSGAIGHAGMVRHGFRPRYLAARRECQCGAACACLPRARCAEIPGAERYRALLHKQGSSLCQLRHCCAEAAGLLRHPRYADQHHDRRCMPRGASRRPP